MKANEILQSTAAKVEFEEHQSVELRGKHEEVKSRLDFEIDKNSENFELVSNKIGIPYLGFKKINIEVDT